MTAPEADHAIVNDHGIVLTPKRWRGHPLYVIYYWSLCCKHSLSLRGRYPNPTERFEVLVTTDEVKEWPQLQGIKSIVMELGSGNRVIATETVARQQKA